VALPEAVMTLSATRQSVVIATARAKNNFKKSTGGNSSCNHQPVATKTQLQLAGTKQCSIIADSDGCWQKFYQPSHNNQPGRNSCQVVSEIKRRYA